MSRDEEAFILLLNIGRPLRIPTLQWLFSDCFNIVDIEARDIINRLHAAGKVTVDNGGWVDTVEEPDEELGLWGV